jgi:hypothetical protein
VPSRWNQSYNCPTSTRRSLWSVMRWGLGSAPSFTKALDQSPTSAGRSSLDMPSSRRPYLWGLAFVTKTDHYSLKFLLDQQFSTIPQH